MRGRGAAGLRLRPELLLWFLLGCEPGPTLVLGRLVDATADASEAESDDAGGEAAAEDAGADGNDSVRDPCTDNGDCERDERPYCSEELERCVECLRDWQCDDDQYCRERTGECIRSRS